jgi:3-hydroxyacyl-CoA dehydrogenase
MSSLVSRERHGDVSVLTIDNPPVNALSAAVWQAIDAAVGEALTDPEARALVLVGKGATFVAGADIGGFALLRSREDSLARSAVSHAILGRIEGAAKPVVAAIRGNALGGGLELAMACHYRVATADAKVGQPEILLGILPGAGGTQRLPRLAGVPLALEMCLEGKPISAKKAKAAGLIDEIVDEQSGGSGSAGEALLEAAVAFARDRAATGELRRAREVPIDASEGAAALAAARASRQAPLLATRAVLEAIEAAVQRSFEEGCLRERELFADCVVSEESKALRHLFFAEREAVKVPDVPKGTPVREIRKAAVIGAGTMGGGIAMAYANAGIPVLLKDVDEAAVERGMATIRKSYGATLAKGKLTQEAHDRCLALITPTTSYDGFGDVDVVVEAVFEDMALKRATFAELGKVTHPECILATNTSTLDLDDFGAASGRMDKVIGHHFFSPAHIMKLLEIVRGKETSAETIATSVALGKRLGKVGAVVGNCFGFVANRMLGYYMREAYLLLEEGASVSQIDRVLMELGMPVGPFGMQDIAGIDVGWRIRQYLASIGKSRAAGPQSEVPDKLYELGRYGQKTGAGWYRYTPGSRSREADPLVEELAAEAAARRGITRRQVSDEEILARITTALANEGAQVLGEGYALRAGDIDVIYCYGFGFPRHRGGPMFYADSIGLPTVLTRVEEYRRQFGDYWQPAPLLARLVAEGRGFHEEPASAAGKRG